jgi:hypothetical protein
MNFWSMLATTAAIDGVPGALTGLGCVTSAPRISVAFSRSQRIALSSRWSVPPSFVFTCAFVSADPKQIRGEGTNLDSHV